jgi:hypothetical protein
MNQSIITLGVQQVWGGAAWMAIISGESGHGHGQLTSKRTGGHGHGHGHGHGVEIGLAD